MERQGGGHTHSQLGMLTESDAIASSGRDEGLGVVRGVLDFGSATGGSGRGVFKVGAITPVTPR